VIDPSRLALFCAAALALLVVPGPAVLYVVTRSIEQGRKAGLVSTLGIHVGTLRGSYALLAGTAGGWLRRSVAYRRLSRYVSATVFVGLGVASAASGSRKPS
jgi:threonine/homoserine/homoserine lactone efflux protein